MQSVVTVVYRKGCSNEEESLRGPGLELRGSDTNEHLIRPFLLLSLFPSKHKYTQEQTIVLPTQMK